MADLRPWTNDEKNELLADLIRTAAPPPNVLFNVFASLNVQPRWEDTPLPRGRSLNQCRNMFDELRRMTPIQQPTHSLMQSRYGPQTPLSAPPLGGVLKRSFQPDAPYPGGREIRPKPLAPADISMQPAVPEPPVKRKRGRPTKAQTQARAAAEGSSDPGPAPPTPLQISPQPGFLLAGSSGLSAGPGAAETAEEVEEAKPPLPPTTRMPISAVLTPTAPKTLSSSSSSSGKRRRGRSMRSEAGGEIGLGEREEYESPYGRAAGGPPADSPARTAVMRHREEPGPSQQPAKHELGGEFRPTMR